MAIVAGLVEGSMAKGLISTGIGLLITVIGNDPIMGIPRFNFGSDFVGAGFPFLPVLIGIFAFSQIMTDVEKLGLAEGVAGPAPQRSLAVSHLKVIGEILGRPVLLLWSTVVGIAIGVLPAIGGSAANMLAYDQAKKFSKHPEKFGTGTPEGIIASESANNANVGGSLVTIMAFGIPGDAVTAVMLGAMTIHGIQSGPLFVSQHPQVAYGIYAAYILAHPLMLLILGVGALFILRVTSVRLSVLAPIVLVLCVIGAYALNNTMQSVYVLLLFGVIGYTLVKLGFPLAPLILGLILGDQIELNLVRAIMTDADPWLFVTRPISAALLGAAALSVAAAIWQHLRQRSRAAVEEEPDF
jgi:putative tricarboxylic transport membrane protein